MIENLADKVKDISIFQKLKTSTVNNMIKFSKIVEYNKNTIIFPAKKKLCYIYFLLEGKAIIYNITHNGNRKIIFILGKEKMLNFNIISDNLSSVFCETIEQAKVLCIKKSEFLKLMEKDFNLSKIIFNEYEKYLWRMSHQLKNTIGNIYIERKMAAKLWKLARDFGIETESGKMIDIDITLTFMADLIGAPRESVSRAYKKLNSKNLVKFENKRFIILNSDELVKYYKNF